MASGAAAPFASPFFPSMPPTGDLQPAANPMQQMMQQMMSNPAMMQQVIATAQQMMQGMQPPGQGQVAQPGVAGLPATNAGFPAAGAGVNPFQLMMQQMMNPGAAGGTPAVAGNPMVAAADSAQRLRFASQLVQLAKMGFTDEAMCLRALVQHNGRVDAAIDVLLSGGAA